MEEKREKGTKEGAEAGERKGAGVNREEVREDNQEREEEEGREKGGEKVKACQEELRNRTDKEQAEAKVTRRMQRSREEWEQKERELGVDEFGNIQWENAKPHNQECFYSLNHELI